MRSRMLEIQSKKYATKDKLHDITWKLSSCDSTNIAERQANRFEDKNSMWSFLALYLNESKAKLPSLAPGWDVLIDFKCSRALVLFKAWRWLVFADVQCDNHDS